jgi:hypothetical protein
VIRKRIVKKFQNAKRRTPHPETFTKNYNSRQAAPCRPSMSDIPSLNPSIGQVVIRTPRQDPAQYVPQKPQLQTNNY